MNTSGTDRIMVNDEGDFSKIPGFDTVADDYLRSLSICLSEVTSEFRNAYRNGNDGVPAIDQVMEKHREALRSKYRAMKTLVEENSDYFERYPDDQ